MSEHATHTDPRPAIVVVDNEAHSLDGMVQALTRRLGNDYRIVPIGRPEAVVDELVRIRDGGGDVALILAMLWLDGELGTSLLARTQDLLPRTQRVVVTRWADFSAAHEISKASVLGQIDHYLAEPWSPTDEKFHATIAAMLAEWSSEQGRSPEAMKLVGEASDGEAQALRDVLTRWGIPLGFYDAESDEGRRLTAEHGVSGHLPAIVLADGRVMKRPSLADIAAAFGANAASDSTTYDVAVLGSGPAGLAAAVYGASEGLRVLVVEPMGLGGQASSSPLIRNYLGFPGGVTGAELMSRAQEQAWTFGAEFRIGRTAVEIEDAGGHRIVRLDDGSEVMTRAIVLATGVTYRRLGIPSVEAFVGRGVFYGSGATEAPAVADADVFVVGGANSAGEAAVHLARYARRVTLLVRGSSLVDGMSDYLIQQLGAHGNIDVLLNREIAEARGDGQLHSLVLRNRADGSTAEVDAQGVFILIGAMPRTDWLPPAIARDERGFVLTGEETSPSVDGDPPWRALETTMPGVFTAGDVRRGSVKRVAAAVGEGATAIRLIHDYLSATRAES